VNHLRASVEREKEREKERERERGGQREGEKKIEKEEVSKFVRTDRDAGTRG